MSAADHLSGAQFPAHVALTKLRPNTADDWDTVHEELHEEDPEGMRVLYKSVRDSGIKRPVKVTPSGSGFLVKDGHHRVVIARMLGLSSVPVRRSR